MHSSIPRNRSGQSVIEYVLLVTAIMVFAIAFMAKNGPFARQVNKTLMSPADMIDASNKAITFYH